MQVFTFCEENYAKSTGAHTALSEWDALTTSEGLSEGKSYVTAQKRLIYFGFTLQLWQMTNKVSVCLHCDLKHPFYS